jgi:hypothetical protein
MNIPLSTWIYSMKNIINHRCAQILIEVRTLLVQPMVLVTSYPTPFTLPRCVTKGVVGKMSLVLSFLQDKAFF